MNVKELIEELRKCPRQDAKIKCSVDCDAGYLDTGRRVFGTDLSGINVHADEALLCFKLWALNEEIIFKVDFTIQKAKWKRRK